MTSDGARSGAARCPQQREQASGTRAGYRLRGRQQGLRRHSFSRAATAAGAGPGGASRTPRAGALRSRGGSLSSGTRQGGCALYPRTVDQCCGDRTRDDLASGKSLAESLTVHLELSLWTLAHRAAVVRALRTFPRLQQLPWAGCRISAVTSGDDRPRLPPGVPAKELVHGRHSEGVASSVHLCRQASQTAALGMRREPRGRGRRPAWLSSLPPARHLPAVGKHPPEKGRSGRSRTPLADDGPVRLVSRADAPAQPGERPPHGGKLGRVGAGPTRGPFTRVTYINKESTSK